MAVRVIEVETRIGDPALEEETLVRRLNHLAGDEDNPCIEWVRVIPTGEATEAVRAAILAHAPFTLTPPGPDPAPRFTLRPPVGGAGDVLGIYVGGEFCGEVWKVTDGTWDHGCQEPNQPDAEAAARVRLSRLVVPRTPPPRF